MIRERERNYGVDLLRLVAMFMIVILHVSGQGGVLEASTERGEYAVNWVLEAFAFCAVNCYAMISGYVSFSTEEKPHRYARYIELWLQVVFWGVVIGMVFKLLKPDEIALRTVMKALLPVTTKRYWYFTAYTAVFFLAPWLNRLARVCDKRSLGGLVLTGFVLFCVIEPVAVAFNGGFAMNGGYGFAWLAYLYMVGAYFRKSNAENRFSAVTLLLGALLMGTVSWAWRMGLFMLQDGTSLAVFLKKISISYMFPTVVGMAMCLVLLFSKLELKQKTKKLVAFLSPAAFGVYLIHTNAYMYHIWLKNRFAFICDFKLACQPLAVIGVSLAIFAACLMIEKLRIALFRLLGVRKFADRLECGIRNKLSFNGKHYSQRS